MVRCRGPGRTLLADPLRRLRGSLPLGTHPRESDGGRGRLPGTACPGRPAAATPPAEAARRARGERRHRSRSLAAPPRRPFTGVESARRRDPRPDRAGARRVTPRSAGGTRGAGTHLVARAIVRQRRSARVSGRLDRGSSRSSMAEARRPDSASGCVRVERGAAGASRRRAPALALCTGRVPSRESVGADARCRRTWNPARRPSYLFTALSTTELRSFPVDRSSRQQPGFGTSMIDAYDGAPS